MSNNRTRSNLDNLNAYKKQPDVAIQRPNASGLSAYKQQYNEDLAALDSDRSRQRQEAAINHELVKKYLPIANKLSGMSGLGVSESANLESLSAYQNNLADIDRSYSESKANLLKNYRAEEKAMQEDQFANAQVYIDSNNLTGDRLDAYLDKLKANGMEEWYLNQLRARDASGAAGDVSTHKASTTAQGWHGAANLSEAGTDFQVNVNGTDLWVATEGEVTDKGIVSAAADAEDGEVFMIGNHIYTKKNGRVYGIQAAEGGYSSDHYSRLYQYLKTGEELEDENFSEFAESSGVFPTQYAPDDKDEYFYYRGQWRKKT